MVRGVAKKRLNFASEMKKIQASKDLNGQKQRPGAARRPITAMRQGTPEKEQNEALVALSLLHETDYPILKREASSTRTGSKEPIPEIRTLAIKGKKTEPVM